MTNRIPSRAPLAPRDRERLLSKAKERIRARAERRGQRPDNERRLADLRSRLSKYDAHFTRHD